MACTHKDSCALFPVISLSSALKIWQTFYCDTQHENCLRYQRSLKGEKVPPNLLPNGKALDLHVESKPASQPAVAAPVAATSESPPTAGDPAPAAAVTAHAVTHTSHYSYYLRFRIKNIPGLADRILQEIRGAGIGIDATITKPAPRGDDRCLIIITDQGSEISLYQAILRIETFEGVVARVKSISLEKQEALQAA